jgi:hypothetical protein
MTEETRTYGELVAAGLRDECDLRGLISESHNCIDCGYDTMPGCPTRLYSLCEQPRRPDDSNAGASTNGTAPALKFYIVHPCVWEKAGMEGDYSGCLCIWLS